MTLSDFKEAEKRAGKYWFSEATMKWWSTYVHEWDGDTGVFITSEQPPHGVRVYTLRQADFITMNVSKIGGMGAYATHYRAKQAMKKEMENGIKKRRTKN